LVKIDELRRALRNGSLEDAMAEHPDAPRALRRYKPSGDGSDALLQFGRHKGLSLKQIQKKDPAYLDRLIMSDVDSELKAIARDVQHQVKIERDAAELDAASAALIENAGKIGAERGKAARSRLTEAEFNDLFRRVDDHVAADPEGFKRRSAARKKWLKR
jgi:hypothetical protein